MSLCFKNSKSLNSVVDCLREIWKGKYLNKQVLSSICIHVLPGVWYISINFLNKHYVTAV